MSLKGILRLVADAVLRRKPHMLSVGESAPDFDALDHRGERVHLSSLRGKKVVLWFFPRANTPG